eukprot:1157224-Pelagomonas_calceolata.AAC.3
MQVKRDYRTPEGMNASEVDADSDGDVLAVLDLRVDSELTSAGLAREVVNSQRDTAIFLCALTCNVCCKQTGSQQRV